MTDRLDDTIDEPSGFIPLMLFVVRILGASASYCRRFHRRATTLQTPGRAPFCDVPCGGKLGELGWSGGDMCDEREGDSLPQYFSARKSEQLHLHQLTGAYAR